MSQSCEAIQIVYENNQGSSGDVIKWCALLGVGPVGAIITGQSINGLYTSTAAFKYIEDWPSNIILDAITLQEHYSGENFAIIAKGKDCLQSK